MLLECSKLLNSTINIINYHYCSYGIGVNPESIFQIFQYVKAKETYLLCCRDGASSVSWLGVGIASYRLGQLGEAEDALVEANILNNLDPAVWGYLSLVCLQTGMRGMIELHIWNKRGYLKKNYHNSDFNLSEPDNSLRQTQG